MLDHLDVLAARRWGIDVLTRLGEQRAQIDALNVYPVPDGDTGTNMYLTVEAAVGAVEQLPDDASLPQIAEAFAQGGLLGARGNSGVILSQLMRGWADVLREHPDGGPPAIRQALHRAAEQAYAAVSRPVEGTMLTVMRAAADAAQCGTDLREILTRALTAANEALSHTPEQLDVLSRAGVVDAGGRGIVVLLDALLATVVGAERPVPAPAVVPTSSVVTAAASALAAVDTAVHGHEVMYLLDADDAAIAPLRARLDELGESVAVVGGNGLWNIHVHTGDVAAALEAGQDAGRPHQIRVTPLLDPGPPGLPHDDPRPSVAVVAVAAGPGLAALFERCGARVVHSETGPRPPAGALLQAVRATGSAAVVLLPNDQVTLDAATAVAAAAREEGIHVAVLPTRAAVQGLAAIAVHDPATALSDNLIRMSAAAGATRHGALTVATHEAVTSAGRCRAGDVLGMVDGDVVQIGAELEQMARHVADRLLSSGGELLTLVTGRDPGADAVAQAVADAVRADRPDIEVSVVDGGQPGYPLLLGLE